MMIEQHSQEYFHDDFMSQDSFDSILKNLNSNYEPILNCLKQKGYIIASSLRKVILIKDKEHCATIAAEPFNINNKFAIWFTKDEEVFEDITDCLGDYYGVYDARCKNKVCN